MNMTRQELLSRVRIIPSAHLEDTNSVCFVSTGELHIRDEKGNEAKLLPGDTFFIHRGSTIVFSTPRYAVAYKSASRHSH